MTGCQLITVVDRDSIAAGGAGGTSSSADGGNLPGVGGGEACDTAPDCGADTDCRTWICQDENCLSTEADPGTACDDGSDCVGLAACACDGSGSCVGISCVDGVKNQGETDIDCGGDASGCPRCSIGDTCNEAADCATNLCESAGEEGGGGAGGGAGGNGPAGPSVCAPCTDPTDCSSGEFCNVPTGVCTPKFGLGAACLDGLFCASGFCAVDDSSELVGVCCDAACLGNCEVCAASNGATSDGECTTLGDGDAPPTPCGAYLCDGTTACPDTCGDSDDCLMGVSCVDSKCCDVACDGICEQCDTGTCGPVNAGDTDAGTCEDDADCSVGTAACSCDGGTGAGSCKRNDGEACTDDVDCVNGNCVDDDGGGGVCCDTPCVGQCQACEAASKQSGMEAGTCGDSVYGQADPGTCETAECTSGTCVCGDGASCGDANGQTGCTPGADASCASGFCSSEETLGAGAGVCCDTLCDAAACESCLAANTPQASDGTCDFVNAGEIQSADDACADGCCMGGAAACGTGQCNDDQFCDADADCTSVFCDTAMTDTCQQT